MKLQQLMYPATRLGRTYRKLVSWQRYSDWPLDASDRPQLQPHASGGRQRTLASGLHGTAGCCRCVALVVTTGSLCQALESKPPSNSSKSVKMPFSPCTGSSCRCMS